MALRHGTNYAYLVKKCKCPESAWPGGRPGSRNTGTSGRGGPGRLSPAARAAGSPASRARASAA